MLNSPTTETSPATTMAQHTPMYPQPPQMCHRLVTIDPATLVAECAVDVMQDNKWYHAEVVGVEDVVHVSYRYFNEEDRVQLKECQTRLAPPGTFTLVEEDVVPGTQVDVLVDNEWHLATVQGVEENAHREDYAKLKIPRHRAFMRPVVNDTVHGRMAHPFSHTHAPDGL